VSEPIELAEDVWVYQTTLWQTNSLLALSGTSALVCDPCWTPAEIEALRNRATAGNRDVQVLLTHADYDHTCGIGLLPDATVVAGAGSAERVRSGAAAESLAAAGREWGLDWPAELRVDRVVDAGVEVTCGDFRIETIDAPGHVVDGLAYLLPDQGVLLPGDYLSAITYPFATSSIEASRRTLERLLEALERPEVTWIVPGHGPPLARDDALTIGRADLAYLERLAEAAHGAVAGGLSPGDSLLAVFAIQPPRANTDDFEVYGIRAFNARRALDEAGGTR
jgi:hydroxyacylglutathione hydrolase